MTEEELVAMSNEELYAYAQKLIKEWPSHTPEWRAENEADYNYMTMVVELWSAPGLTTED